MTALATEVFGANRVTRACCVVAGIASLMVLSSCSSRSSGDVSSTERASETIDVSYIDINEAPTDAYPELFNGTSGEDEWTVSHAVEGSRTCVILDYLADSMKACDTAPDVGDSHREPIVPMHYRLASDHDAMVIVGLVPDGVEAVLLTGATEQVEAKVNSEYGVFILSGSASAEATALEIVLGERTISCDVDGGELRDLTYFCN